MYEIFEKLMLQHKVNAYTVSKATGISNQTLSAWKKGEYTPKVDKLEKIAQFFDVSLDYLKGEEKKTSNKKRPRNVEVSLMAERLSKLTPKQAKII